MLQLMAVAISQQIDIINILIVITIGMSFPSSRRHPAEEVGRWMAAVHSVSFSSLE
jgi:hypothetical protein